MLVTSVQRELHLQHLQMIVTVLDALVNALKEVSSVGWEYLHSHLVHLEHLHLEI